MKSKVIAATLISMVAPATAQTAGEQADPGAITQDIPVLWQADRAVDTITKTPGEIAEERAAEARQMAEEGNNNAAARAVNATRGAAENANSDDVTGLQNAENIISNLNLPTESSQGINQALSSINRAQSRVPEDAGQSQTPDTGSIPEGLPV